MRTIHVLALTLLLLVFPAHTAWPDDTPPDEARTTAEAWLALRDSGAYGACWDQTSPRLQAAMDRGAWIKVLTQASGQLGPFASRTPIDALILAPIPDLPPGPIAAFTFSTAYASATIQERIVLHLEDDTWRVVGYWLQ